MPSGQHEKRYKPKTKVQRETPDPKIAVAYTSTEKEVGNKPKRKVQTEADHTGLSTDTEVFRHLPSKLQELSRNIQDYSVTQEIDQLVRQATEVAQCATHAFSVSGSDVLQQKKKLSKVRCPSKVDIEILSQILLAFIGDLNSCLRKALAMKSSINVYIEMCKGKQNSKRRDIEEAEIEISGLDRQIRLAEQDNIKYEEDARNEERGADELDNRSRELRRESERHREKGVARGVGSFLVELVFAPFTAGVFLLPALTSAGIGMKVNFDNADDCDRTAAKLRFSAADKMDKAQRQWKMKQEFQAKKTAKTYELRNRKMMIENISRTCNGLNEDLSHLQELVSMFERTIDIVQDFQVAVHTAVVQGDVFALIKEVFAECPDECHDEVHEGLFDLKRKWYQLEMLILDVCQRQAGQCDHIHEIIYAREYPNNQEKPPLDKKGSLHVPHFTNETVFFITKEFAES